MLRILVALSLALLPACGAADAVVVESVPAPEWMRAAAADAWAGVGVTAPADYSLLVVEPSAVAVACDSEVLPGSWLGGCTPTAGVVVIADVEPSLQLQLLIHEVGHLIRGTAEHLRCAGSDRGEPGTDAMCAVMPRPFTAPTLRDAAFVR